MDGREKEENQLLLPSEIGGEAKGHECAWETSVNKEIQLFSKYKEDLPSM